MAKYSVVIEFEARNMLEAASIAFDFGEHCRGLAHKQCVLGYGYGLPTPLPKPLAPHGQYRVDDGITMDAVAVHGVGVAAGAYFASQPKEPTPPCTCYMGNGYPPGAHGPNCAITTGSFSRAVVVINRPGQKSVVLLGNDALSDGEVEDVQE